MMIASKFALATSPLTKMLAAIGVSPNWEAMVLENSPASEKLEGRSAA